MYHIFDSIQLNYCPNENRRTVGKLINYNNEERTQASYAELTKTSGDANHPKGQNIQWTK